MSEPTQCLSINAVQDRIVQEMGKARDWFDKYEYLIGLGKQHPPLDAAFKTDRFAVQGCQSHVWIDTRLKDGRMHVQADSDALITRGIIALLVRVFDGQSPQEAATADLYFIREVGLTQNLSPSRANGLTSIVQHLKSAAAAHCEAP